MLSPKLNIFCINLDTRPERWEHLQKVIKDTGIQDSIVRIPGIVAATGIEGCRESHISVIRKAKDQNLPWVGIMEDDCTFYDHFSTEFPKILEELWQNRNEWEIYNSGPIDVMKCVSRFKGKLVRIGTCVCTQFVIIQRCAYDKLLQLFNDSSIPECDRPIDQYYRVVCENKIMTSVPPLTYQYTSVSDIQTNHSIGGSDEFRKSYQMLLAFSPENYK